jgi:hypothetical protein
MIVGSEECANLKRRFVREPEKGFQRQVSRNYSDYAWLPIDDLFTGPGLA